MSSNRTEMFVLSLILANCITLALSNDGIPDWLTNLLDVLELIFTIVFAIEMILKVFLRIKNFSANF